MTRSSPGIDGYLDDIPVSLKSTGGGLGSVLKRASEAERSAFNAGFDGVDLYIDAPNVGRNALADFASKGPLSQIPGQGTIRSIYVQTSDGWWSTGN